MQLAGVFFGAIGAFYDSLRRYPKKCLFLRMKQEAVAVPKSIGLLCPLGDGKIIRALSDMKTSMNQVLVFFFADIF